MVIRNLIDQNVVQAAATAFDQLLDRAVAGEFGDSFRWLHEEERIPHLDDDFLTPTKYDPAFGEMLETMILVIERLLEAPVRCSWLLLLTGGAGNEYGVPLHRDDNMVGGDDELELIDRFKMQQSYFQAPLLPNDRFLQVVPGSHLRAATEIENAVATSDVGNQDIPELVTIELQPGDAVFRHTDLLHQGWNPQGLPRWTMVSAMWANDVAMLDSERKYYDILKTPGYLDRFPKTVKVAVRRYLEMFERETAEDNKRT